MAYSYQIQPNSNLNRTSWGPISVPSALEMPGKLYDKPMSGNFDRIINAFERTNAFQYVRSTFEHANCKGAKRHSGNFDKYVRFENSKNDKYSAVDKHKFETSKDDERKFEGNKYPSDSIDISSNQLSERYTGHGDILSNRKALENLCSSFDRADGSLASRQTPCSDEDVADYYQERIVYSQARQLFPLQEDLADWINKTIGITYLTGDNFLDVLDNGYELCELAAVIRDKAKEAVQRGRLPGPVPTIRGRCWKKAARRSFFSRDNMENFITFCRELGVHENLLFESDDLVMHAQPRNVVLCLLEVARLATKYDVEPPGLVQFEREIAMEENDSGLDSAMSGLLAWQFRGASPLHDRIDGKSDDESSREKTNPPPSPSELIDGREVSPADDGISAGSGEDPEIAAAQAKPLFSELDKRVQLATRLMQRKCNCSSEKCSKLLKVKKVGEGRYNIAGRNVFIRLLKGRHMMVRVGGGWDTLEHFLSRHDPCQVRLITPSAQTPTSPNAHTITTVDLSTLNIAYNSMDDVVDTKSRSSVSLSHSDTSSDGKKTPPNRKPSLPITLNSQSLQIRRQSLTLPLKNVTETKIRQRPKTALPAKSKESPKAKTPNSDSRKTSCSTDTAMKKSRSMSLTSPPAKSPVGNIKTIRTPDNPKFCGTIKLNAAVKKIRSSSLTSPISLSPTNSVRALKSPATPKFCGTDRLNANAKKSRSASLTSPIAVTPRAVRSPGTPNSMSQSFIEVGAKSPLSSSTPNKPAFLQIKAKYRSPPPKETPPR